MARAAGALANAVVALAGSTLGRARLGARGVAGNSRAEWQMSHCAQAVQAGSRGPLPAQPLSVWLALVGAAL